MNLSNEIWLPVVGYEGLYCVSNIGRIKSIERMSKHRHGCLYVVEERIRKPCHKKDGYLSVDLYKDGNGKVFLVHRLVAMAFIDNPHNKSFVNHLNKNKHDNSVPNLEWATIRENESHKNLGVCTSKYIGVSWNARMSKWRSYITINKKQNHLGYYNDEIAAASAYINALSKFGIENKYSKL